MGAAPALAGGGVVILCRWDESRDLEALQMDLDDPCTRPRKHRGHG
jgi:hypothetical protein